MKPKLLNTLLFIMLAGCNSGGLSYYVPLPVADNGINYYDGDVMIAPKNIHIIWYGGWANNTATSIIPAFITNLSNSPYFNINSTYWDYTGAYVDPTLILRDQIADNYSHGKSLNFGSVESIVQEKLDSNELPTDETAIYLVLTSADVSNGSFCSSICGYHDHFEQHNKSIKYVFAGDASVCPNVCMGQQNNSPNNNLGADGIINILGHELSESTSDPNIDAWLDDNSQENADKCAWKFGNTYELPNGSLANMRMNGADYLIQQNWTNAKVNGVNAGCRSTWPPQ